VVRSENFTAEYAKWNHYSNSITDFSRHYDRWDWGHPFLSSEAVGKVAAVLGVFVGLLTGIRSSFGINDKLGFYQTMADQFRSLSISIEFVQQADEAVFQQFAAKFLELREAAIRGTPRGQDIPSSPSPGT